MLHVWGAGAATYAALRIWRPADPIARPAALLGALAYMFSDVLITHIGNLNVNAVVSHDAVVGDYVTISPGARSVRTPSSPRARW